MNYIIISALCLICFSKLEAQSSNIILESNFEAYSDFIKLPKEVCCPYSMQLSDSVARSGRNSLRVELNRQMPVPKIGMRSELAFKSETNNNRWYGFSIFLPANYEIDKEPEIVAQWHEIPDFDLGETWRSPPIALEIINGIWRVNTMWAYSSVNTNKTIDGHKEFYLGGCTNGKWTDWVFHIVYSWKEDGIIAIWQNGNLVAQYKGPNCYNDEHLPYFKLGIYKWVWADSKSVSTVFKRILYFDELRVGNENASYKEVAPR